MVVRIDWYRMENELLLIVSSEKFLPIQEPEIGVLRNENPVQSYIAGAFDAKISYASPTVSAKILSVVADL